MRSDPEHAAKVQAWREQRVQRLLAPDSWLTLIALHWLPEGMTAVGGGPANDLVLAGAGVPPRIGMFRRAGPVVEFVAQPGVAVSAAGRPVEDMTLVDDDEGKREPTVLETGSLRLQVIRRGERLGLRVKDGDSAARRGFVGLEYFPIDSSWRVEGIFVPAAAGATLAVPTVLDTVEEMQLAGTAQLQRGEHALRLDAVRYPGSTELFFIFADQTNGKETYGAGRFLYAPAPTGERVALDFNQAYNPPCVFTPYATCPLPPPQNRLPVRVEAGEKMYAAHP